MRTTTPAVYSPIAKSCSYTIVLLQQMVSPFRTWFIFLIEHCCVVMGSKRNTYHNHRLTRNHCRVCSISSHQPQNLASSEMFLSVKYTFLYIPSTGHEWWSNVLYHEDGQAKKEKCQLTTPREKRMQRNTLICLTKRHIFLSAWAERFRVGRRRVPRTYPV